MEKIYRQSAVKLAVSLFIDFLLILIFIGFFLIPMHIIEYLRNSITITPKGVLMKRGILTSTDIEIPFQKINTVTVKRGVFGKIFGYGDVYIFAGNDIQGIPFKGLETPEKLKAEILNLVK